MLLAASVVARLPQGMGPLAVLLVVQARTGSLSGAALASGAWGLGAALGQAAWARHADRAGARAALVRSQALQAAALLALVPAAGTVGPATAFALLAGLGTPPVSSIARAAWPRLLRDREHLRAFYGVDAAVQELIFVAGPLVVAATAAFDPALSVYAAVLAGLVGTAVVSTRPEVREAPVSTAPVGSRLALARTVRAPLAVAAGLMVALGAMDVAVPAAGLEQGSRAAGPLLIAVWALGSLTGGIVLAGGSWGRSWRGRLALLAACGGVAAAGAAAAAGTLPLLGVALFANGLSVAPALALIYDRIGTTVPEHRRTEAFGLVVSALIAVAAISTALAGALADATSSRVTFAAAAATLLALAAALALPLAQRRGAATASA
jgi:MFS family permease